MARIRYTLENLPEWHEIELQYQLSNDYTKDEHDLSYIIQKVRNDNSLLQVKKVEIYDDEGMLVATSPDILTWRKLKYINEEEP